MSIKLSISSYCAGKVPEKAVLKIVKAGFHYAELGDGHSAILLERGEEAWGKFRKFAEDAGLLFRQAHLPLHNDITSVDEAIRLKNVALHRAYCKMYHALGITSAVLHCGGYDAILHGEDPAAVRARRVKSLKDLLSDLPEGMTICLENLPYETFDDVNANLADCGFPENLGFCLDTGHLHFSPEPDHASYILRAGKRLKAMHMHDNAGPMSPDGVLPISGWLGSDKHMFPGYFTGSIDWDRVIGAMREIGYDHLWNLELSADLNERIPSGVFRDLVLRQDREKAEIIFNYDPAAPLPDDPVNDYGKIAPVESAGVSCSVAGYRLKLRSSGYELLLDPVHSGRICSWKAYGRELVEQNKHLGWAVLGNWQPAGTAFALTRGMKIESVTPVKEGIQIVMSRTLDEDDNDALAGVTYLVTDVYTVKGFVRKVTVVNPGKVPTAEFAFRFHCMPAILGGKNVPAGTVRFADGMEFKRNQNPRYFRIAGHQDSALERVMTPSQFDSAAVAGTTFTAPQWPGKLTISYPGEQPCALCFWDNVSNCTSFEPIFKRISLAPGAKSEYAFTAALE